jgi:hypothetical protein
MVQQEIEQNQVQGLITGALDGYQGLLELEGRQRSYSTEKGLFAGTAQVSLGVAGRLEGVVSNMLGLTLRTTIPEQRIVVASDAMDETLTAGDVDAVLASYDTRMGETAEEIATYIAAERERNEAKAGAFKEAMTTLNESYESGDIGQVAAAVEDVAQAGNWGTVVEITPLYRAVEGMLRFAQYCAVAGFKDTELIEGLDKALRQAEVDDVPEDAPITPGHKRLAQWVGQKLGQGKPRATKVEPLGQVYEKQLDWEVIARDLMNVHT